ncbi:alpha-glucan family phosphorylase [Ferviditalea candida]|uniref:Alpha-glucan family phosphorylase n=1 Tax=Ferviditalea candida TaxID=3108399 RepID=A0ABU5ZIA8_9BACL|nr:alpha-glucan family phosphorylase [Paenibacillaceae bacterium T2]
MSNHGLNWFESRYPEFAGYPVAYFSAEFGIHESLPIYSGGLGILAGDHCKSAGDLGIPLVGIGLLYRCGYFRQKIDAQGNQQAELQAADFSSLPIRPVLQDGSHLRVSVDFPGRPVHLKVWAAQANRTQIYLLDADDPANTPEDRQITNQLYGGGRETRLQQEILLGVGGVKTLNALGIKPGLFHLNEGHAAFAALERLRKLLHDGLPFNAAMEAIRAGTLFTTHTPVPAGHDVFDKHLFLQYFQGRHEEWDANIERLIDLGWDSEKNGFNMTYLALNTATKRNAVSKLHGRVSREMFRSFHGGIDAEDVPVESITNGVHLNTWMAAPLRQLLERHLPADWRDRMSESEQWNGVERIPDEEWWAIHQQLKADMIRFVRSRIADPRDTNGQTTDVPRQVRCDLRTDVLTIGFARRFAAYKRATLLFSDLDRLDRIVNHPERPVRFLYAGKAHPADISGQDLIREVHRVSQMDRFFGKILLLEDYDMEMARCLVQGVDVWMNTPQELMEASGTSGQKAAMNGVLNFSVLDGWWAEGFDGTNGFAIADTASLYDSLEQSIAPLYYLPGKREWVSRTKQSVRTLAPVYNTDRMVREYAQKFYVPIMERSLYFQSKQFETARRVADFKAFIQRSWKLVRFLSVDERPVPEGTSAKESKQKELKQIEAVVDFGPVWYKDAVAEIIYYEENGGRWDRIIVPMRSEGSGELPNRFRYRAEIPRSLQHGPHFRIRLRPDSPDFAHPFELPLATWSA